MAEQDLRFSAIVSVIVLLFFGILENIKDYIFITFGLLELKPEVYPFGCAERTLSIALSYSSSSTNSIISPLMFDNITIRYIFQAIITVCQWISFFMKAFPYDNLYFVLK